MRGESEWGELGVADYHLGARDLALALGKTLRVGEALERRVRIVVNHTRHRNNKRAVSGPAGGILFANDIAIRGLQHTARTPFLSHVMDQAGTRETLFRRFETIQTTRGIVTGKTTAALTPRMRCGGRVVESGVVSRGRTIFKAVEGVRESACNAPENKASSRTPVDREPQ